MLVMMVSLLLRQLFPVIAFKMLFLDLTLLVNSFACVLNVSELVTKVTTQDLVCRCRRCVFFKVHDVKIVAVDLPYDNCSWRFVNHAWS